MRSFQVISGENALAQQFTNLRADAAGGGLLVHQQLGFFTLSTNPANTKTLTLTINGTAVVFTFVTSIGSTPGNVLIGGTAAVTCANLLALLNQPQTTTSTGVALSAANQTLLGYLSYALSGTTLTISSNNTLLYAPETSFSGSTTATSDSYTAQTLQLYVEPGVFYIAGTRVVFAGGSTPTVTAPSTHPRIDVLSINSSGTLSWTAGSENVSPTAPAYPNPAANMVLCEITNVVSETQLLDYANQSASQGYVSTDVRPDIQPAMNWGAFSTDFIPDADGTRNLGSATFEWNNGYFKTAVFVSGLQIAVAKFGGIGTDGALSISSGTTTISLSGASYLEKNYTSISITGTGNLAFSSPNTTSGSTVALRSQANVTLTSSSSHVIDVRGLGGGLGTSSVSVDSPTSSANGFGGIGGASTGGLGSGSTFNVYATGSYFITTGSSILSPLSPFLRFALPAGNGSAGGTGGANGFSSGSPGSGGIGGGGLYIECGGAYNFTTGTIDASGAAGSANANNVSGGKQGGAGGGGAGGTVLVLYTSLTADSGTYSVSGGAGGTAVSGGNNGNAGASGSTFRVTNKHFS